MSAAGPAFEEALEELTRARGVLGGLLATEEGLTLAARLAAQLDQQGFAAAAAELARCASSTLARLDQGELELAVVDTSKFRFLVRCLSVGYLLVVAQAEANVGLLVREMARAAAKVEQAAAGLAGP